MKYPSKDTKSKRQKYVSILGGVCNACGSSDSLEFDHIDPRTTRFRISGSNLQYSHSRIMKELSKCQLLCKSCHMIKTLKENGKSKSEHGSASYYNNKKCRCSPCKKAWADNRREYQRKYRLQEATVS